MDKVNVIDKVKHNLIFYMVLMLNFYVLPCFIKDTGSAMIFMLMIMPFVCFITSVVYGLKNGFCYAYILIVILLFLPSVFIFYNATAWSYSVGYGMLAMIGNLVAVPFRKR